MENKDIDTLHKEIEELKKQISVLEEQVNKVNDKTVITREVLDDNFNVVYRKLEGKRVYIVTMISSLLSVVLIFIATYLIQTGGDFSDLFVCYAFLSISTFVMGMGALYFWINLIKDIISFVKNKKWRDFRKNETNKKDRD